MARKTLLAVDDDPVVREAINELFSVDYNILLAQDGHEAIEIANNHHIDLILLDIMMPGFDGFSTLMLLKEDSNTKDVPVVMLTAVGKKENVITAFRDGAAGYVLKPFKADTLRNKISSVITQVEDEKQSKAEEPGADESQEESGQTESDE